MLPEQSELPNEEAWWCAIGPPKSAAYLAAIPLSESLPVPLPFSAKVNQTHTLLLTRPSSVNCLRSVYSTVANCTVVLHSSSLFSRAARREGATSDDKGLSQQSIEGHFTLLSRTSTQYETGASELPSELAVCCQTAAASHVRAPLTANSPAVKSRQPAT